MSSFFAREVGKNGKTIIQASWKTTSDRYGKKRISEILIKNWLATTMYLYLLKIFTKLKSIFYMFCTRQRQHFTKNINSLLSFFIRPSRYIAPLSANIKLTKAFCLETLLKICASVTKSIFKWRFPITSQRKT